MSMKNLFGKFFYLEEEEEIEEQVRSTPQPTSTPVQKQQEKKPLKIISEQPVAKPTVAKQEGTSRFKRNRTQTTEQSAPQQTNEVASVSNNVVSLQAATSSKSAKVVLIEPRVYAEAQDIAENIKNKRATIVNLQRIDTDQGVRIIDFLSGTVYALGGDIQKIGPNIFLCTPENVEVSGEISDYIDLKPERNS